MTRQDAAGAVERLASAGLLDDLRTARIRAEALAEREYGDRGIAVRLRQEGIDAETATTALAGLEPERERAIRIAAARVAEGRRRVIGRLSRRGFSDESLEAACASLDDFYDPELG